MGFLPPEFSDYIAPGADRKRIIQSYLEKRGVDSACAVIDGKSHIVVRFGRRFYNPMFRIKTVVAHYDRVAGSPGANDNSAADFQIMDWAVRLSSFRTFHNVRIVFTDGEELGLGTGVSAQGAFGIASVFRRLGIVNDDVYVFDSCGRGTIPLLASADFPPGTDVGFLRRFGSLFSRTEALLSSVCGGRWISLPAPYSDNASFLACGIPAVALTMLPAEEASLYALELQRSGSLKDAVLNRDCADRNSLFAKFPLTWRLFHTAGDNAESLCAESFSLMARILDALARSNSMA